jgi:hypothetical protein
LKFSFNSIERKLQVHPSRTGGNEDLTVNSQTGGQQDLGDEVDVDAVEQSVGHGAEDALELDGRPLLLLLFRLIHFNDLLEFGALVDVTS